jgi:outer membrane receptor protein involved in Fe transport
VIWRYRYQISSSIDSNNASGAYSFTNQGTALPLAPANTGDSYASFLLGFVQSGSIALPFEVNSRKPYLGFFVQDDYRVTPRLTLNLGYRHEMTFAPYEINDQYVLMDPPRIQRAAGWAWCLREGPGRIGSSRLLKASRDGFGPRFCLPDDRKTVVRGGYGIYYADNQVF